MPDAFAQRHNTVRIRKKNSQKTPATVHKSASRRSSNGRCGRLAARGLALSRSISSTSTARILPGAPVSASKIRFTMASRTPYEANRPPPAYGPVRPVAAATKVLFRDFLLLITSPENALRIQKCAPRERLEGFPLLQNQPVKQCRNSCA